MIKTVIALFSVSPPVGRFDREFPDLSSDKEDAACSG
jgi:hypothetical protein